MLPRKVYILGQPWAVRTIKNLKDKDGKEMDGLCYPSQELIEIKRDKLPNMVTALLHEVIHAILLETGVDLTEEVDEIVTIQLERNLLRIFNISIRRK